jgi:cell division protein FtsZ
MTLNLTIPKTMHTDFTPRITVIGVGGGGTNAVDNMIQLNLQGVEFVVANTDAQQLMHSRSDRRIQLGPHLTQGLGAGAKPEIGRLAAEEAADELARHLDGAHMVFITAGMGGGTGTGAAPVIARMARERGILTVGVVTKPFTFEGIRRSKAADVGIAELQQFVDTLIVIPNQNLFRLANEKTGWKEAFKMADHVLYMGVRGVTDLMVAPGLVNLDFADIRTVMAEMGKAMMGTGEADGENRAIRAAEAAISNPLLEDTSMAGARGLLINITGGEDMTLFEVDQAANRIREEVAEDANIIFGSAVDDNLAGRIRVSVVATGIDTPIQQTAEPVAPGPRLVAVGGGAPAAAPAPRVEAPRPEQRQAATAQAAQRFPVSAGATAVAYAHEEEEEERQHHQAALQTPQPRPAQQHPLFTQQATPEPTPQPQPHRASLFGMVTGGWRRAPQPPAPEMPDLRHHRPEPRFAAEQHHEPGAQARASIAEPEPQGLDIPAFLRRQDSGR